jgi:hypothetical protein
MTNETLELFYSYAPEDKKFLARLDNHLASLKRSGVISAWSTTVALKNRTISRPKRKKLQADFSVM